MKLSLFSFRKILNELSSDTPAVPKIEEEKSEEEGAPPGISPMSMPTSLYQTSSGQYSMFAKICVSLQNTNRNIFFLLKVP